MRFLSLTLLSSTVILYLAAVAHFYYTHGKIGPIGHSNTSSANTTIHVQANEAGPSKKIYTQPSVQYNAAGSSVKIIHVQPIESCPSNNVHPSSPMQSRKHVSPGTSRSEPSSQIHTLTHRKVVGTLRLVGLLITILLVFTGPRIVTLFWSNALFTSLKVRGIVTGLFSINSMINPFLYVWKLEEIRNRVKILLCCCNR
jgi:hypothetical protein